MAKLRQESGTQSKPDRFRQAARDIGADEADDALDRAFGKLNLTKKSEPEPRKPVDK